MTIKGAKDVKVNSVNPLYLIFNNGYFEEINERKYFTLVLTNEIKEKIKRYEELWSKMKDLIRLVIKNSDGYHKKKYMRIKFNSDYELPVNKTIEILTIAIVVAVS